MDAARPDAERTVEHVAAMVIASRKYARLHPDTIRRIAARELAAHPRAPLKELAKATRRGLHQVTSAFERQPDYEPAFQRLAAAFAGGSPSDIRAACRHALALHASTRERLPILDEFYARLWQRTGVPASILDLGCGLNPLSLPWMDLPPGARYEAFDVDGAGIEFVNRFLHLAGREPPARWQDILARPPTFPADVALLLKSGPSLEHQEKAAMLRLIRTLPARVVVVSFAVASLGGRDRGMVSHYRRRFLSLAAEQGWTVDELSFATEMVFIVPGSLG